MRASRTSKRTIGKNGKALRKTRDAASESDLLGDDYFVASQWTLMWRKFRKHGLAKLGGTVIIILAILAIFSGFFSTYDIYARQKGYVFAPPTRIHIFEDNKLRWPFVYKIKLEIDPVTYLKTYTEDRSETHRLRFFIRGDSYKLLGIIPSTIHFVGVKKPGSVFLFGTDDLGRDLYSRIISGARISLSIGLVGIAISFVLGCLIGGLSGYYGGSIDMITQRVIEFLGGIPSLPLWMTLSAALPPDWPIIRVYFGITVILSIQSWTGLARTVRGKMFAVRGEEFVLAAKIAGVKELGIVVRHLLPSFTSHLIVVLTMRIPGMILGETSMSFLGLGLRPPAVSWGVLLYKAQNIRAVLLYPWILIPGLFVIITILSFNFLGDGLRDAADPYK